ncbi:hypothetical protein [Halopiger djelfimassiliensis]|uniref:hypothetical protein n=1 Tax=Halopiger djelfimassiliensis TaxID=1293047 RepID=UPI000AA1C3A9|nr:hypothetical protein [Halopiger djelfimassiliensis]
MCHYCLDCGWRLSTSDGYTDTEVSERAIDHFVETGHTVESVWLPPPVVANH